MTQHEEGSTLLSPGEVAALFRVNPKTVTRWAQGGKLTVVRTPGGHRRYWRSEVETLRGQDPRDTSASGLAQTGGVS